jgi:membrane fusion protein (multidrug efflux system)
MSDEQHETSGEQHDDGAKPKRQLSGRAKLILLVLAVAVLAGGGLWFGRYQSTGKFMQETNDAYIRADFVTIAPKISGYVAEVLVSDNQDVAAGQPLVRVDPRSYRAQAAQAEAQIAQAEASADSSRAQIRQQRAAIEQARAQLAAAQAKAAYDATEVRRFVPLAASGAESRQQLAQLRATADQSAANVRAQAAALAAQQRQVGTLEAQIGQARAQRQGAAAQLAAANVDVGATILRAPVAGRIGDKTVTVGQFATAGTRLMSVVPLSQIYVTANFKETQLALMRPGQPARIAVDALDGTELRGRVASVSPGTGAQFSLLPPQNATGNFTKIVQRVPVRIALEATPEARRLLVPGMSVTVTVDTRGAKGQLDRIREQQERLTERTR